MSALRQLLDVLVAGLIAGSSTFVVSAVAPGYAITIGTVLASMYYFSRYPWGIEGGGRYNERIDAFYDRVLPG
ncbi:hypothetical protein [Halostella litorea]|uniref:hypothetical protein n=1 Tax=Halostella litorea TaxID=2528831 RepID=UPI001092525E|nr:hypothetical protein [Halostella litorea]